MKTIDELFMEWIARDQTGHAYMRHERTDTPGRSKLEIARDILALAGEQRLGQVIIRGELIDHPIIREISERRSLAGRLVHPPGMAWGGELVYPTANDAAWVNLPLPS